MAENIYKALALSYELILPCVTRHGAQNAAIHVVNDKEHQLKFSHNGKEHLIKLFPVKGGAYSLGKSTGNCPETFEHFASKISEECCLAPAKQLNLSFPKVDEKVVQQLLDFLLVEVKATCAATEDNIARQYRLVGPKGDTLSLKHFKNGTIQLQGKYLHLATETVSFLTEVLDFAVVLEKQIELYQVDTSLEEISNELEARIPVACSKLSEPVKVQLRCALMLCMIDGPMEDFSAVAFPALRGLEGFIKDLLVECGFKPAQTSTFADYFREGHLDKEQAGFAGDVRTKVLNTCYAYYSVNRHRLFHMDAPTPTTRVLTANDARAIVSEVLNRLEDGCKELAKNES